MPESVVIRPLDKTKTIIRSQDLKPIKYNSTEMNYCIILSADPEIQKGKRAEFIHKVQFLDGPKLFAQKSIAIFFHFSTHCVVPTRKQFLLLFAHTSRAPFSLIETLFDLSVNTYTHTQCILTPVWPEVLCAITQSVSIKGSFVAKGPDIQAI